MWHLRFTPYDISGYTFDFLENYPAYIVAQEDFDDDENPLLHYHVLIESDYGEKTIRDAAKAALKIPATGKGKNNKYYAFIKDWKDPGYICKYNNVLRSKGYSPKQILDYVINGRERYLNKLKRNQLSGDDLPAPSSKPPKVPFQQAVIAAAAADWINYKKACTTFSPDIQRLKKFVCDAMREHGKGINKYLVRELAYAVLYDDLDYRQLILDKIEL